MKKKRKKWSEIRWFHFYNGKPSCGGYIINDDDDEMLKFVNSKKNIRRVKMVEL